MFLFFFTLISTCAYSIAPSILIQKIDKEWSEIQTVEVDLWQKVRSLGEKDKEHYIGFLFADRGRILRLDYCSVTPEEIQQATDVSAFIRSATRVPDDIFLANMDILLHYDRSDSIVTKQYVWQSGLPPMIQALAGIEQFDSEQLREDYDLKPVVEQSIRGHQTYRLTLLPVKERANVLPSYYLWVDQDSTVPIRLRVLSREEEVEVEFHDVRLNRELPENVFDVTFPPGTRTIDRTQSLY